MYIHIIYDSYYVSKYIVYHMQSNTNIVKKCLMSCSCELYVLTKLCIISQFFDWYETQSIVVHYFAPKKILYSSISIFCKKIRKNDFGQKKLTKSEFHEYQMIEIWYNDFSTYLSSVGTVRGAGGMIAPQILADRFIQGLSYSNQIRGAN